MPTMELKKHQNSDKVFVWSTFADLSDETPTPETLAIRFGNAESMATIDSFDWLQYDCNEWLILWFVSIDAQKFKKVFEESKEFVSDPDDSITNTLNRIHIKDNNESESESEEDTESDEEVDEKEKSKDEKKEPEIPKNEDKSDTKTDVKE